jgi:hypothetical protein
VLTFAGSCFRNIAGFEHFHPSFFDTFVDHVSLEALNALELFERRLFLAECKDRFRLTKCNAVNF